MKIVITADIHNNFSDFLKIYETEKNVDYYFDLGDSLFSDDIIDEYNIIGVRGNADSNTLPFFLVMELDGHRFLLTHGHLEGAYYSLSGMLNLAKENNCDVCFYGHTHLPKLDKIDSVQFINPGSVRTTKTYIIYENNEIFLKKI